MVNIETAEGTLSIPKDAAVFVMKSENDVAIYDFDESLHGQPVTVLVNGKPFKLSPGVELLLTKNTGANFGSLNPDSGIIGYRNIKVTDIGNGTKAVVAEFSIANAMCNIELLRHLVRSQEPKHQKLIHGIIKNAAIVADLTGVNYKTSK